jgi:hypothetical protein
MISRVWSLVKKQFLKQGLKWSGSIQLFAIITLAVAPILMLPEEALASATSENKSRLVFEIKSLKNFEIPESLLAQLPLINSQIINRKSSPAEPAPSESTNNTSNEQIEPIQQPVIKTVAPTKTIVPAKAENKIFMHEPEIREYVCPKLGDRCDTFIAILKAENGTHECTRDNRGLNKNGSVDVGLAQINWSKSSPYTFEQLQDCRFNLDIALKKIEYRGFQPWVAYNKGIYKKFLNLN